MDKHISDFVIHVHEEMSPQEQNDMEDFIIQQPGVVGVGFSSNHSHLITVAYDCDDYTAHSILSHVREHSIQAEMIGL